MPQYKNSFRAPDHIEETIVDEHGAVIGTIRIKPSGVLWKPRGKQKFYRKSLDDLTDWMTNPKTKATRVKQ